MSTPTLTLTLPLTLTPTLTLAPNPDQVDELARQLGALRLPPGATEAAEYTRQLEARDELIAAQRRHEQRRRAQRAQRKRAVSA